jgi:hypothetical protein
MSSLECGKYTSVTWYQGIGEVQSSRKIPIVDADTFPTSLMRTYIPVTQAQRTLDFCGSNIEVMEANLSCLQLVVVLGS